MPGLQCHTPSEPGVNGDEVLSRANLLLKEEHSITQTTLQVEGYQQVMDECGPCQEPERTGVLHGLIPSFLRRKKRVVATTMGVATGRGRSEDSENLLPEVEGF